MSPNAEDLGARVAAGHATDKHLLSKFSDLGIETPEQFSEFVASIVDSKETLCFTAYSTEQTWRQADFYYHEPTNTMVVDPFNQEYEPTAYPAKNGINDFYEKLKDAEGIEGRSIEVFHGMGELYQETGKTQPIEQESPQTFDDYRRQYQNQHLEPAQDKKQEQDLER